MKLLLSSLLLFSMLWLPTLKANAEPPVPVVKKMVIMDVELYSSYPEVWEACNIREKGVLRRPNGCAWEKRRGIFKLIARVPNDWWDVTRLETLGHEMLHALGYEHAAGFSAPWVSEVPLSPDIDVRLYR